MLDIFVLEEDYFQQARLEDASTSLNKYIF